MPHVTLGGRRASQATLAVLAIAALVACGGGDQDDPPVRADLKQYGVNMDRCLSEKGWDVEVKGRGFIAEYLEEQREQFEADQEACRAEFGYDQPAPPMTRAEVEQVFDAYLAAADCVRQHGFDPGEPPSEEAFIEETLQEGLPPWHPHFGLLDQTGSISEAQRIEKVCPIVLPPDHRWYEGDLTDG